jgi:hypothetical protein
VRANASPGERGLLFSPGQGFGILGVIERLTMTKFERALVHAALLPKDMQEQLGEDILHFVDRYLALRDDLDVGIRELDAGLGIPADIVFADLRKRFGA